MGRRDLGVVLPDLTPKISVIIQARMNSRRFPGKVFEKIGSQTMLEWVVERARMATRPDNIVVATSEKRISDFVADRWQAVGNVWPFWWRGPEDDVLSRYLNAAHFCGAEIIVRITADCPLIDPWLIDTIIDNLGNHDLCSNVAYRTFPKWLDVEVLQYDTLVRLNRLTDTDREHVTLLTYQKPDLFDHEIVMQGKDVSWLDWSVDTPDDLSRIRDIYGLVNEEIVPYDRVVEVLLDGNEQLWGRAVSTQHPG